MKSSLIKKAEDMLILKIPKRKDQQKKSTSSYELGKLSEQQSTIMKSFPLIQKKIDRYLDTTSYLKLNHSLRIKAQEQRAKHKDLIESIQRKTSTVKHQINKQKFQKYEHAQSNLKNIKRKGTHFFRIKSEPKQPTHREQIKQTSIRYPTMMSMLQKQGFLEQQCENFPKIKQILKIKLRPKPKMNPKLVISTEARLNKLHSKILNETSSRKYKQIEKEQKTILVQKIKQKHSERSEQKQRQIQMQKMKKKEKQKQKEEEKEKIRWKLKFENLIHHTVRGWTKENTNQIFHDEGDNFYGL